MIYVDDVVIRGLGVVEHDRNLEEVLEDLVKMGLHVNKIKMQLCKEHVSFLVMM